MTVKRFATAFTPIIVLAALAAPAQAQPRSSSLNVPRGKAAVNRVARRAADDIEQASSFMLIRSEVSACGKHGTDVICLAKWFLPLETCSARFVALPVNPILVKELGEMACAEHNNEELDGAPVPSSSTPSSSSPVERHVTLRG